MYTEYAVDHILRQKWLTCDQQWLVHKLVNIDFFAITYGKKESITILVYMYIYLCKYQIEF